MRAARNRWVLAVDNDAVLRTDVLGKLSAALAQHPDACVAQPRSVFADDGEKVHYDGAWFHYVGLLSLRNFYVPLAEAEGRGTLPVDGAISMTLLLDRDVVLELGGYDEDYFILFEDYDLSLRLRMAGHQILSVEDAIVRHMGGTAGISFRSGSYPQRRAYYHARNRWILLAKAHRVRTLLVSLPGLAVYELVWLVFTIKSGHLGSFLRGKLDFARALPRVRAARRELQSLRKLDDKELLRGGPLTFSPELLESPLKGRLVRGLDAILHAWWETRPAPRRLSPPRTRMKILLVSHDFLPEHAMGTEIYTWHLGCALRRRGHDVHVFTTEKDVSLPNLSVQLRDYDGLPVHELINNLFYNDFRETWTTPRRRAASGSCSTTGSRTWCTSCTSCTSRSPASKRSTAAGSRSSTPCTTTGCSARAGGSASTATVRSATRSTSTAAAAACRTSSSDRRASSARRPRGWRASGADGARPEGRRQGCGRHVQGAAQQGPRLVPRERSLEPAEEPPPTPAARARAEEIRERDQALRQRLLPRVERFLAPSRFLRERFLEWGMSRPGSIELPDATGLEQAAVRGLRTRVRAADKRAHHPSWAPWRPTRARTSCCARPGGSLDPGAHAPRASSCSTGRRTHFPGLRGAPVEELAERGPRHWPCWPAS